MASLFHWILHRLSFLLLLPLNGWIIFSFLPRLAASFFFSSFEGFLLWLQRPWPFFLFLAWVGLSFYHTTLCIETMIDDYISSPCLHTFSLWSLRIFSFVVFLIGIFALIRIKYGNEII